ncbi:MAG: hypothetical protein KAU95_04370, partial [Candidatus Aenigmarchaeota archaeon]|nr:hypothetical protein [Candidatus Aenigmarchaeota archaeon]
MVKMKGGYELNGLNNEKEKTMPVDKYYEFSRNAFFQSSDTASEHLKRILPIDFYHGDENDLGDVGYRLIKIPDNREERKSRIAEILSNGKDRTDTGNSHCFDFL